jgi:hypothetical protein
LVERVVSYLQDCFETIKKRRIFKDDHPGKAYQKQVEFARVGGVFEECFGTCGKVFQAVGVAIPPTIREVA